MARNPAPSAFGGAFEGRSGPVWSQTPELPDPTWGAGLQRGPRQHEGRPVSLDWGRSVHATKQTIETEAMFHHGLVPVHSDRFLWFRDDQCSPDAIAVDRSRGSMNGARPWPAGSARSCPHDGGDHR